jgi:DNA-binding transcriptional LysR family regulator
MPTAHLSGLDLNLLVQLDALLAEAHVTRAAQRAGVTQSAMSRALGRLRELLGDPLLVRTGRGMILTARARALAAPLARALGELEAVVLERPSFDPRTSRRTFTIATSDFAEALILPPLLAALSRAAPGVDVAAVSAARDPSARLEDDATDVAVAPRRGLSSPPSVVWRSLFSEGFLCLLRRGHPVLRKKGGLTLERFLELPQVMVAPGGSPGSPLDDALAQLGRQRRVAVRVPSFLVSPLVIAESDLIATLPERLARRVARYLPVVLRPLPFTLAPFELSLAWHERFRHDAGHAWFRRLLAEVATTL